MEWHGGGSKGAGTLRVPFAVFLPGLVRIDLQLRCWGPDTRPPPGPPCEGVEKFLAHSDVALRRERHGQRIEN